MRMADAVDRVYGTLVRERELTFDSTPLPPTLESVNSVFSS